MDTLIRCPYCGNKIYLSSNPKSFGITLLPLSVTYSPGIETYSSFNIKCKLCGRKYEYFPFDNFDWLYDHLVFKDDDSFEIIGGWFKKNYISFEELMKKTIAIVIPKYGHYLSAKNRIKRRFRVKRYEDVEIIFMHERNGKTKRGALIGELYRKDDFHIKLKNVRWID